MTRYFTGYSTTNVSSPRNVRYHDIDIVKRDIRNNFYTRKGERPMDPLYGSVVWDMLFETHVRMNIDIIIADSKKILMADARVKLIDLAVQEYEHGLTINAVLDFEPDGVRDTLFLEFVKQNKLIIGDADA